MPIHFQIFDQTPAKMKRVNSKNAPAKLSGIYIYIYIYINYYLLKLFAFMFEPADTYLFKVNNKNTTDTRKKCKICSKLIIKTPE